MHSYHLLEILAIGFGVALVFGYLAQRVRLSPIVDSVSLSVASTEEGKAATIMDFTVRIELRQPEEVSQ